MLLEEALASVAAQEFDDLEVIVIDDGSTKPVSQADLTALSGHDVILHRNPVSCGIAAVRDQGVKHARGEYIVQLDDDDQLAPGTLVTLIAELRKNTQVDVLHFGVAALDDHSGAFAHKQHVGVQRILNSAAVSALEGSVYYFDSSIFAVLLDGVPLAFQRLMTRRSTWLDVREMISAVYAAPAQRRNHFRPSARRDLLNEAEWTIYAATKYRLAYLDMPLYMQRCTGQRYFSRDDLQGEMLTSSIAMKSTLHHGAQANILHFGNLKDSARRAYANSCAQFAYWHMRESRPKLSLAYAKHSLLLRPSWSAFKTFLKALLRSR